MHCDEKKKTNGADRDERISAKNRHKSTLLPPAPCTLHPFSTLHPSSTPHPTILLIFALLTLVAACAPTSPGTVDTPYYAQAVNLYMAKDALTKSLITSLGDRKAGKFAVADLIGPGENTTALGEHLSDKLSVALFSSGKFADFLERKQLKELLASIKTEGSPYFDQSTVSKFGKMIGVDSMVIGTIKDMGTYYDVTAKIVSVENSRLLAMADVQMIKDDTTRELVGRQKTASLTITVDPPVGGTVIAGGKKMDLEQGNAIFADIPFGECSVVIQPRGHNPVRKSVSIRSRTETLSIRLEGKTYTARFQIVPPDAELTVDGKLIKLNTQGFALIDGLPGATCSYVIKSKGFQEKIGTFNPETEPLITLDLHTKDPLLAAKTKFFQKTQSLKDKQDFEVKLWTNQESYQIGDPISFYFKAEKDCYVNLVDIASSGEIRLIFPNRIHPDNHVTAGKTYRIPDDDYGFTFEVEPPAGIERVYAVASTRPLKIFDSDFSKDAFQVLTRGKTPEKGLRGIGTRVDRAKINAAAECVIEIRN